MKDALFLLISSVPCQIYQEGVIRRQSSEVVNVLVKGARMELHDDWNSFPHGGPGVAACDHVIVPIQKLLIP